MERRKKKRQELEQAMINERKSDHREGEALSHPP